MKFVIAGGGVLCQTDKRDGLMPVIEVNCPKCGVNVSPSCLIMLNVRQEVQEVDGYGLVTPCCHMVVAADRGFMQWVEYQNDWHQRQSKYTSTFNENGMVCDISGGVTDH